MEIGKKAFSKIAACHYVLPKNEEKNSALVEKFGEKKIKNIERISGIKSRRVAPEGVCASDLEIGRASYRERV